VKSGLVNEKGPEMIVRRRCLASGLGEPERRQLPRGGFSKARTESFGRDRADSPQISWLSEVRACTCKVKIVIKDGPRVLTEPFD